MTTYTLTSRSNDAQTVSSSSPVEVALWMHHREDEARINADIDTVERISRLTTLFVKAILDNMTWSAGVLADRLGYNFAVGNAVDEDPAEATQCDSCQ